jgi:preprotein translocase subunit SecE
MVKIKNYFNEVIQELKKVTWPSKKQTANKTILVLVVSLLLAIYLGGLDFLFQQLAAKLFN